MDAETAEAYLGLGRAQAEIVPTSISAATVAATVYKAFGWYLAVGDLEHAVAAATSVALHAFGMPPQVREMVTGALAAVPPRSILAARLLLLEAGTIALDDADYDRGAAAFETALAIARAAGDRSLEARALANWAYVDSWHMRWPACLEHSMAAAQLAVEVHDEYGEMLAHEWAMRALIPMGRLATARERGARALDIAERLGGSLGIVRSASELGYVAVAAGEWDRARELLVRSMAADPHSGYEDLGVNLESQIGNTDEVDRHIVNMQESERLAPQMPQHVGALAGFGALAAWLAGSNRYLEAGADRSRRLIVSRPEVPLLVCGAYFCLAIHAVRRGDATAARNLSGWLARVSGEMMPYMPIAGDHLLGLLSQTMGNDDAAVRHFDAALTFTATAGYRPAHGWAAADYASMLLDRDAEGDHSRAVALQDVAIAIGRELGMVPLVDRVLAQRNIPDAGF